MEYTLEERQLKEKNKVAMIVGVVIAAIVILLSAVSFTTGFNPLYFVRMGVAVAYAIALVVVYFINKCSDKYKHLIAVGCFVVYLALLFTSSIFNYYALIFPIAAMISIYQEKKLIVIGAIGAIAANIGFDFYYYSLSPDVAFSTQVVIQFLFIIMAVVAVYMGVSLTQKHMEENMQVINDAAEEQKAIANQIFEHSKNLGTKFAEAIELSATLNETMGSSHMAVSEIAEASKHTAENVEQQTKKTSEIQNSIETVQSQSLEMSDLAKSTQNAVKEGVILIDDLRDQSAEVERIAAESETLTIALNDRIKEVENITDTILEISSQTNLLALNASIEAARAGEAGKGFAVVADEIRNLSEGTRQATEKITEIIKRLTVDAGRASDAMSTSAEYAKKENEMISETGSKLEDIKKNADALYAGVQFVTGSVDEIVVANTAITDSITNLSATSQQVAASTESSLALSDDSMSALNELNDCLDVINRIAMDMEELASK